MARQTCRTTDIPMLIFISTQNNHDKQIGNWSTSRISAEITYVHADHRGDPNDEPTQNRELNEDFMDRDIRFSVM